MRIAIITARGGSKRIPGKNTKDFLGKPIIAYSIQAAIESGTFEHVMVSTDSEEIASVARGFGAEVPFLRSARNADDHATTADVLIEVLREYKARNIIPDSFVCLYPTAPFITAAKLKEAIALLDSSGADSVFPVVRFSYPPQRGLVINNGSLVYGNPEYQNYRSQDLEPIFHDCGQFYAAKTSRFLETGTLLMKHTVPLFMDEFEVQDIDNESDWALAEMKYILMCRRGRKNASV